MKVVINSCFGGFSLSDAAIIRYAAIKGITLYPEKDEKYPSLGFITWWTVPADQRPKSLEGRWMDHSDEERQANNAAHAASHLYDRDIERTDPALIQVVEEMGREADGRCAELKVIEIPDDLTDWYIHEYDGSESVKEGRTWD